jgi:O-antigen ligase
VVALLPLTLPAWIGRGRILSVALDRFSTVLFLIVLILSTSSTAYVGILILALLLLLVLLRTRIISVVKATVLAACAVAVIVTVAVVSVSAFPVLGDVAKSTLLDKSETFSGLERVMTIELAYGYFVRYPLLGIGWGSAVSHDLIIMLWSNVGVIGALTFLGAMWYTMRSSWRVMDSLDSQMGLSRAAWFLSLAVTLSISIFSGFPLAMGNFWVAIGMVIATSWRSQTERERQYTPALA